MSVQAEAATTLLPNGKQCFSNANGPVIAGTVNMFFVGTTTPKATWQDSNQVTLNTQPIVLDASGCAVIYGVGAYRQQLFYGPVVAGATSGSLIWDQITTDTSAFNSTFWAGTAGGTPNVITVVDTGFNGTDGSVVNFTALATNTGATTVNPSGFGAVSVVKDTAAGPVALTGGEIVQSNIISLIYSASGNNFHLLNTSIPSASGNSAPLCGANNLKITNNSSTPSTIITITADTAVMVSNSGVVINRGSINQSINISTGTATSTAGGMDGEAPGTSAWLTIFLIDNGAAPAALAALSAGNNKTPNMPSGYTFRCYLGSMRVDGGGSLLRTLQRGAIAQYTLVSPSNTQTYPLIGTSGSATPTSISVASFAPPTASTFQFGATNPGASAQTYVSPNAIPTGNGSQTNPAFCGIIFGPRWISGVLTCEMVLETQAIFASVSTNTTSFFALGWRDQVNAN